MIHTLAIQATFEAWRDAARPMLMAHVPPEQIVWTDDREAPLLPIAVVAESPSVIGPPPHVPKRLIELAKVISFHRDPQRWGLLYRLAFRASHGEPHLLEVATDDDVLAATSMEKSVRRDRHKMTAFVRFRRVERDGQEWYVAWHRPDHYIVRLVAPFFRERFGIMNFAILTPDESMSWDGVDLVFGEGVARRDAPEADELESLWLTYYANIFNPARIKLGAMRKEMPVRHWPTLPETAIIPDLLQQAEARVERMMEHAVDLRRVGLSPPSDSPETSGGLKPTLRKDLAGRPMPVKRTLAQVPDTLDLAALRDASKACLVCEWACKSTQTVFGEGPAHSPLVMVGEQPGDSEDLEGRPFIGPAGQLLAEVLEEVGLDRTQVYVTNAVKHFKFELRGKRRLHQTPTARDSAACAPWLHAELKAIKPQMVVALGATAARTLFGAGFRVTQSRGEIFASDHAQWSLATFHPSMLLRIPDPELARENRKLFTDDLRSVAKAFAKIV